MDPIIHHMPDGRPAPSIMTCEEVVEFLRADLVGVNDPRRTLDYYRQRGLKAKQIGRAVRFMLTDVVEFVERLPDR